VYLNLPNSLQPLFLPLIDGTGLFGWFCEDSARRKCVPPRSVSLAQAPGGLPPNSYTDHAHVLHPTTQPPHRFIGPMERSDIGLIKKVRISRAQGWPHAGLVETLRDRASGYICSWILPNLHEPTSRVALLSWRQLGTIFPWALNTRMGPRLSTKSFRPVGLAGRGSSDVQGTILRARIVRGSVSLLKSCVP
jgi:hypothetical protein